MVYIRVVSGLYRDNGKMETTIMGYIRVGDRAAAAAAAIPRTCK